MKRQDEEELWALITEYAVACGGDPSKTCTCEREKTKAAITRLVAAVESEAVMLGGRKAFEAVRAEASGSGDTLDAWRKAVGEGMGGG